MLNLARLDISTEQQCRVESTLPLAYLVEQQERHEPSKYTAITYQNPKLPPVHKLERQKLRRADSLFQADFSTINLTFAISLKTGSIFNYIREMSE